MGAPRYFSHAGAAIRPVSSVLADDHARISFDAGDECARRRGYRDAKPQRAAFRDRRTRVTTQSRSTPGARAVVALAIAALAAIGLVGCDVSSEDTAQARVDAKEKAVTEAEADFADASKAFCDSSKTYIQALDQYGDVLNATAPTVGDVRQGGADLVEPREDAF